MNARGMIASMIGLAAGCTAAGGIESDDPGAGFRVDRIEHTDKGTPYFLAGQLGRIASPIDDAARAPEALAGVLPAIAEALRVPAGDLVATRVERDALGMTHVRMAQQKNGLRVVGGDAIVQIGADGVVRSVSSNVQDRALDATPAIAEADAIRRAIAATEGGVGATRSGLTYVISTGDDELYLAWEVRVAGGEGVLLDDLVYVDAHTGRVVDRRPQIFTARNRRILDGQGRTFPILFPPAPQVGSEGTPPTDPVGLAAYDNTGSTYDCYQTLFQRDSYDGAGAQLTSVVHIVFSTGNGGTTRQQRRVGGPARPDGVRRRRRHVHDAARPRLRRHHARAHPRRDVADGESRLPERVGRAQRGHERHHRRGLRGVEGRRDQRGHLEGGRGHLHARDRR